MNDRGEDIFSNESGDEERKNIGTERVGASAEKGFGEISGIEKKAESLDKADKKDAQQIVPEVKDLAQLD